jgi:hypothetical protein
VVAGGVVWEDELAAADLSEAIPLAREHESSPRMTLNVIGDPLITDVAQADWTARETADVLPPLNGGQKTLLPARTPAALIAAVIATITAPALGVSSLLGGLAAPIILGLMFSRSVGVGPLSARAADRFTHG